MRECEGSVERLMNRVNPCEFIALPDRGQMSKSGVQNDTRRARRLRCQSSWRRRGGSRLSVDPRGRPASRTRWIEYVRQFFHTIPLFSLMEGVYIQIKKSTQQTLTGGPPSALGRPGEAECGQPLRLRLSSQNLNFQQDIS